jgi:hypothetical protein
MRTRAIGLLILVLTGSLAASCSKGGKGGKSGDDEQSAYDEEGHAQPCPPPESDCEDRKEASLAFKDACDLAGFRMRFCGCVELCSGQATGARQGYDRKNKKLDCEPPKETCPEGEESAAFQDACSEAGGQLMECGCSWLCSEKLKEALPDPAPAEEPKADEAKDGDKKDGDKKDGDKKDGEGDDKKDDKKSDKKKKSE